MNNDLILVDLQDNRIGTDTKENCHRTPKLHRAFSVFLYNNGKLLLQKRALNKYHSGGLIANTCCSHPRTENLIDDAKQRLVEECGISISYLEQIFCFTYLTKFSDNLFEFEYDHVLIGKYTGDYAINKDEVLTMFWIDYDSLLKDMQANPLNYASWFLICAPKVVEYLKNHKF